jgi:hypothetical protein
MDNHRGHTTGLTPSAGSKPDARGLVLALELMELGIELAQQRIARQHPNLSHSELVAKTNEWISAPRNDIRSHLLS